MTVSKTNISDLEFERYARGEKLYGDDFSGEKILAWYKDEEHASFEIYNGVDTMQYDALNEHYAFSKLRMRFYEKCIALGIADGKDIEPFSSQVGEIIGIEPEERWWKKMIGNTKATYLKPAFDGNIPIQSNSCDIAICFGVLHHIPNVSFLVGELSRVLKVNGVAVFREPVSMMGDFRIPRPLMSPHERGIPPRIFKKILKQSGFHLKSFILFDNPLVSRTAQKIGFAKPYNNKFFVNLDMFMSYVFKWNIHYFPKNIFQKIAPSSVFIIVEKI